MTRSMPRPAASATRALGLAIAAALAGCGGGSGGSSAPAPVSQQGTLSFSLAIGGATPYQHVWVTVKTVALASDASLPWMPDDPRWTLIKLPTPITLDLAALTSGTVGNLLVGQWVAPGTYGQMRLLLAAHDAPLESSAAASNLQFNDEVDFVDDQGNVHRQALELPQVNQGFRIAGPFVVQANHDTLLTVQWDIRNALLPIALDNGARTFTLRSDFRWYDLENTAAILGVVDKSRFCPAGQPAANCIYDVTASAEISASDGSVERSVRSAPVTVNGHYATFGLYPLPALQPGQTFDVVLRGRNMPTYAVLHIPAPPSTLLQATPVVLGANPADAANPLPIAPVVIPTVGAVTLTQPLQQTSSTLVFSQTLPGAGTSPLEVDTLPVDPFSGRAAAELVLTDQAVMIARYDAQQPLSFSDFAAAEGDGSYGVSTEGRPVDLPSPRVVIHPDGQRAYGVTATEPPLRTGVSSGVLTVNLSGGSTAHIDAARLVVSDANGIVATRDVSSAIGISTSVNLGLPAGDAAAALGSGSYSVSVRVWKRANASGTGQWVRAAALADLIHGTSATVALTLP